MQLGVGKQTMGLMMTSVLCNDLGGSDKGIIIRNILNAAGLTWFSIGATIIAAGGAELNTRGYFWTYLLALVIFLTVHMQDLPDMKGDAVKGRRTLPLVHGEKITRLSIAVLVLCSSSACAGFWQVGFLGYSLAHALSSILSARVLLLRNMEADGVTWKLWSLWMATLYTLPLVKACGM